MRKLITLILLTSWYIGFSQNNPIAAIDGWVKEINEDRSTRKTEFDASEAYGQAYDGGGTITIYSLENEIVKIEEEIGLSTGIFSTIIYLKDSVPIKIVENESNYKWKDDQSGFDYNQLNSVFDAEIYIFDYSNDNTKVMNIGERVFSEGTCSLFEYEGLLEIAYELFLNK